MNAFKNPFLYLALFVMLISRIFRYWDATEGGKYNVYYDLIGLFFASWVIVIIVISKLRRYKGSFDKTFKVGQVYRMHPASRSHVKTPYYVEIVSVTDAYIKTNIPGHHSLIIHRDSGEWEYHIPQMELVGTTESTYWCEQLRNQPNLLPE